MADKKEIKVPYTRSPGWTWNLMKSPKLGIPTNISKYNDGKYKLLRIGMQLTRVKNPAYPIYYVNGTFIAKRGQVKSSKPITVTLEVEGQKSSSITISEIHDFKGTAKVEGVTCHTDKNSWVPVDGRTYEFTFANPPIIKKSTKLTVILGDGYTSGNTSGISLGKAGWKNCYWVVEEVDTKPVDPPKPPQPPSSSYNTIITNKNDVFEDESKGVLKDQINKISRSAPPSIYDGTDDGIGMHGYAKASATFDTITVEALKNDTDYSDKDTITLVDHYHYYVPTANGGQKRVDAYSSFDVDVNFYETIKREEDKQTVITSARDVPDQDLIIEPYKYLTKAAKAHNAFRNNLPSNTPLPIIDNDNVTNLGVFTINNDTNIPLTQYFTLDSDSNNKYKIAEDHTLIPFLFRFYNSVVQTEYSDIGTYKKDLWLDLKICCAPTMPDQFSYEWLDRYNHVVEWKDLPEIFLLHQEDIMVGNLRYSNEEAEGGYCRAFRCTFRDYYTKQTYVTWDLMSEDDFEGITSGKIMELSSSLYARLPELTMLELTIIPFFYFNDSPTIAYYEVEIVIPQLFIKGMDEDVIFKLFFPVLSKTAPYTPMMLPEVERFGYSFEKIISDNWPKFKSKIGINIGGYDLFLAETKYWSNYRVVQHMIVNMGHFVNNHQMFTEALEIKPFIITMVDTPQEWRDWAPPNDVILCTTEESMWTRPIAISGQYLRYFDWDRFMQFINKYKPLRNNEYWQVPEELRGYQIDTGFWIDKANVLNNKYVASMYSWVTEEEASNIAVCWMVTQFNHIKGEYFQVLESRTTHDYLHDMKFTHDYLHNFTHDQITRLATVNNLKQNYYDLLQGLSAYVNLTTHNYLKLSRYAHDYLNNFSHDSITLGRKGV